LGEGLFLWGGNFVSGVEYTQRREATWGGGRRKTLLELKKIGGDQGDDIRRGTRIWVE